MILPGAMLGMLGGGQLGRMFTQAAHEMGYRVTVLDPDPHSPAGAIADHHLCSQYEDQDALREVGTVCAAVTTEFENVPASSLTYLRQFCPVRPEPEAVAITQDRVSEKRFALERGLATARFYAVGGEQDLQAAWQTIGPPAILKTNRLGYDGKGQALIRSEGELHAAYERFGQVPCILEEKVPLDLEVSVVLARATSGAIVAFPVGENRHVNGILDTTVVPARVPAELAAAAHVMAGALAEGMGYVGTMGVEFFVSQGALLVNEMAPRPHNSGHYTQDACTTDQFEQQVRAICGLPLGEPRLLSPAVMVNLLGDLWTDGEPQWAAALVDPRVKLHLYGKTTPRAGRKMGHLNVLAASPEEALGAALAARERLLG